jgi:hypothetical protein
VTRYTFLVQVHPDGVSSLENLTTRERVRITDLDAVGPQIARWLEELVPADALTSSVPADRDGGAP